MNDKARLDRVLRAIPDASLHALLAMGIETEDAELERIAGARLYQLYPDDERFQKYAGSIGSVLVTQLLAHVQPETVTWAWRHRVPFGKLTLLDGDPGLGKSSITLDLAARLSQGRAMPDGSQPDVDGPAAVFLLTVEDGLADTVRPRLDAAGADVGRIMAVIGKRHPDGRDDVATLPDDLDDLEMEISKIGAKLVIIDPLMAFLGGRTNAHHDQDVRRALAPLAAMAERTGAAVLVVRHLNKAGGANPLYRGGGSIGIIGAARSGLLVASDPDDAEATRRILALTKSNLGTLAPALAYEVIEAENGAPRIEWLGPTDHQAADLLSNQQAERSTRSRLDEAMDFLRDLLQGGPRPAGEIECSAEALGISIATLRRARQALGVESDRKGYGGDGGWIWRLPDPQRDSRASGEHLCDEDAPRSAGNPRDNQVFDGTPKDVHHIGAQQDVNAYGDDEYDSIRTCSGCGSHRYRRVPDGPHVCVRCGKPAA